MGAKGIGKALRIAVTQVIGEGFADHRASGDATAVVTGDCHQPGRRFEQTHQVIGGECDATGPGAFPFHRFEVREVMLLNPVGPGLEEPGRFLIAIAEAAEQQTPFFIATNAAEHLAGIPGTLATRQESAAQPLRSAAPRPPDSNNRGRNCAAVPSSRLRCRRWRRSPLARPAPNPARFAPTSAGPDVPVE